MSDQIDVFISYKLDERPLAETVMRALRDAGYVAVTNFNIFNSQEFGDAIDKMIREARLTLALWTAKSAALTWVCKEVKLALDLEKAGKTNLYLGVMVEDVSIDLPVYLRELQMVDATQGGLTPEALAEIVTAVQERLGRPRSRSSEAVEVTSSRAMDEFQLYELRARWTRWQATSISWPPIRRTSSRPMPGASCRRGAGGCIRSGGGTCRTPLRRRACW